MFGRRSILLFGDFGLLPPIGDTPLYDLEVKVRGANKDEIVLKNLGLQAYLSITENITLDQIM